MSALFYTTHASAIGTLLLVGGPSGLTYLTHLENDLPLTVEAALSAASPLRPRELPDFFASTTAAIDAYLAGHGALKLPYHLDRGTPLQRAVWLALAKIPYGETVSYSTLAERVGFPRAVRAIASACGANPLPLLIPCHRVIAKDGGLGGFSLGGVEVKEHLLALEGHQSQAVA